RCLATRTSTSTVKAQPEQWYCVARRSKIDAGRNVMAFYSAHRLGLSTLVLMFEEEVGTNRSVAPPPLSPAAPIVAGDSYLAPLLKSRPVPVHRQSVGRHCTD